MIYRPTPRLDVVDDHFGTPVPDPYRWLEDPNSPDVYTFLSHVLRMEPRPEGEAR